MKKTKTAVLLFLLSQAPMWATVRLAASAGGNFTAAGTWNTVDSVGYIDSEAGSQAIGVANVDSPTFTWGAGAPTVLGFALKVASRSGSGATTMTCTLRNTTDSLDVKSVTVNATDLDNAVGWYMFDFGGGQALSNGKNYIVRCVATAASAVTLYRSTTGTTNFSKMIVTSATGAPAAGDQLHITAWWTAAATKTDVSVVMNNNTTDSFGPTVSGGPPQGMTVSKGGTLTWATASNTKLFVKGLTAVYTGGTMAIGTSGTPIGAVTAEFRMDSVASVDSGLYVDAGGTFSAYGPSKTTLTTLLTTDAAVKDDHIHVGSTAGWAVGDVVVIASTSRTPSEIEAMTILTVDSATQVTFTGQLANAHSGTSPTQAEVADITRGALIKGSASATPGYIRIIAGATTNFSYAEFQFLGSNTGFKRGIDASNTTFAMDHSSLHEFDTSGAVGINVLPSGATTFSVTYTTFYQLYQHVGGASSTTTGYTFDHCLFLKGTANAVSPANVAIDGSATFTNNTLASNAGWTIRMNNLTGSTISDLTHHSNGSGIWISGSENSSYSNLTIWRNASKTDIYGLSFSGCSTVQGGVTIDTMTAFGNDVANLSINCPIKVTANSLTSSGDSTFSTPVGLRFQDITSTVVVNNGSFSQVTGIKTAHTTNDIQHTGTGNWSFRVYAYNTLWKSGFTGPDYGPGGPIDIEKTPIGVYSMRHNQTAGDHQRFQRVVGRARTDTIITHTSSPSERLIPLSASSKILSGVQSQNVANGGTVTFSAWVRKSVVADGGTDPAAANYNGNEPRLILKANPAVGINADVVLATMTLAIGNWELLTGTSAAANDNGILQAYVDCDGTAGWINVDDWDGGSTGINWSDGFPLVLGSTSGTTGTVGSAIVQ